MIEFDFKTQYASAEWLSHVLSLNGYLSSGSVECVKQGVSSVNAGASATVYELSLDYSRGSTGTKPSSMLMKVATSGETEGFESVAARYCAWLLLPQRHRYKMLQKEPVFYQFVREKNISLPLVKCFGSAIDETSHSTCLLLEDISGSHVQTPWPIPPNTQQCEATIRALARLHACWWNDGSFGGEDFPSVSEQVVQEVVAVYADAYNVFKESLGDRLSESRQEVYEKSVNKLPTILTGQLLESKNLTLIHGDFHHWNVLLPKSGEDAVIFDWQTWHVDVGAHDLAYFIGVSWFREHRSLQENRLLRLYLSELNSCGIEYKWEQLVLDYRRCIIRHLFTPVIFSTFINPAVWWHHMERVFCTFEDWHCADLLD